MNFLGPGGSCLDEDDYGLRGGSMWGVDKGLDGMGQGGSMGKNTTKRGRTSFKRNQLRIMRSHFQVNIWEYMDGYLKLQCKIIHCPEECFLSFMPFSFSDQPDS